MMDHTVMPKAMPDKKNRHMSAPDSMPEGAEDIPPELGNALVDGHRLQPKGRVETIENDEAPRDGINL